MGPRRGRANLAQPVKRAESFSPWCSHGTKKSAHIFRTAGQLTGDIRKPMSHTYTNILIHAIFSTKGRHPWIDPDIRSEVFSYLGGTINALGGQSLLVNGPRDHVHLLFRQPPT